MKSDYPEHVLAIYENSEFIDCYTVYFDEQHSHIDPNLKVCLCLSENPEQPNGVYMHSMGHLGDHNGKRILWDSLPDKIKNMIETDLQGN